MATPDDQPGPVPVDPVFASLFRPEDDSPPAADDAPDEGDPAPEPDPEPAEAAPAAPAAAAPPTIADPLVDTGRLFRSQGVTGHEAAVLALSSNNGGRLHTLVREQAGPAAAAPTAAAADQFAQSGPVPLLAEDAGPVNEEAPVADARSTRRSRRDRSSEQAPRASRHGSPGISAGAVYIIVIGFTLVVAIVNALIGKGELGWPTGIALVISSVYCALRVRREDDIVAFIIPPIAFFICAITAGQFFRGPNGGGLLNRTQLVFFTLAYNWYWVIGATVAALVIVLVRRRRG